MVFGDVGHVHCKLYIALCFTSGNRLFTNSTVDVDSDGDAVDVDSDGDDVDVDSDSGDRC